MPQWDLSQAELESHRCTVPEPDGLDAFWTDTLAASRAAAKEPQFVDLGAVYGPTRVDDVTFSGGDGHPIRGWFARPREHAGALPCVVRFIGYGGGRGRPVDHLAFAASGIAVFVMDSRAQGGEWGLGDTGDPGAGASGAEHPGVMTRGIAAPGTYYFRRMFADAVRAVETAATHPEVDASRIAVAGFSQGGALSLAAAALAPDKLKLTYAYMPFLCDIERAAQITPEAPYTEIAAYLSQQADRVDEVTRTLRHIDCALLARRIRSRCRVSVGLMDTICPPSTVYAAYNAIESPKELTVYPYTGHEETSVARQRELEWILAYL